VKSPEQLADQLDGVARLYAKYGIRSAPAATALAPDIAAILSALGEFMECVRYLNTRRSKSAVLKLDSEAAVQDAIFLMLRPWLRDLTPENPTDKAASRFVIKDFLAKSAKTIIEAKYIRDPAHGKNITRELHDDIEMYRHHAHCRHLVFFIYDPNASIPDRAALQRQIGVERLYDGVVCR
jgi:hypothetical protein